MRQGPFSGDKKTLQWEKYVRCFIYEKICAIENSIIKLKKFELDN